VRKQLEACGTTKRDSRRRAIVELARRCEVELPRTASPPPSTSSEASTFWQASTDSVLTDEVAAHWLERHGLVAGAVDNYDALRVVAPAAALPEWAGFMLAGRWYSWAQAGHRLIVPLVSVSGTICALLFCNPLSRIGARISSPSPSASVMADPIACHVLATRSVPGFLRDHRLAIVVADGVLAFLRHVTGRAGGAARCLPVLGVVGGALDPAFVARLPGGTHLLSSVDVSGGDRLHAHLERLVETSNHDLTLSRLESR
jgi:hypothetical protein